MARLEGELGQRLLYRSTRSVRLSAPGETFLAEVTEVVEALDRAADNLRGGRLAPRGLLRVNAPVAFGRLHVAPYLHDLQAAHTDLEIELDLTDALVDPVSEGADVVVRIGAATDSAMLARKLADQRHLVMGAPDYLARRGVPQTPADLDAHDCLQYRSRQGTQTWHFARAEHPFVHQPVGGNLRSNDATALVEAALAGQGLILFPTWLVHAHLQAGHLQPVLEDWRTQEGTEARAIRLLFPEGRMRSAKVQAFIAHLIDRIGTPPYWDSKT